MLTHGSASTEKTESPGSTGKWIARLSTAVAVLGCVAAVVACLWLGTSPALGAESCPSEQSLLPASGDPPFTCAQMENSGKKSLNPGETKTWTKSISLDKGGYDIQTHCEHPNDKNVTVSWAGAVSSYSATGTNWGTGDHSFGAGVLFVLYQGGTVDKDSYKGGCSNDDGNAKEGRITNSIEQKTEYAKLVSGYSSGYATVPMYMTAQVSPSNTFGPCYFQPIPDPPYYELTSGCVLLFEDDTSPKEGDTPIATGKLENGTAELTWTPTEEDANSSAPGMSKGYHTLTVMYAEDTTNCPSDNATCGYSPTEPQTYTTYIQPAPGSAQPATQSTGQRRVEFTGPAGSSVTAASRRPRLPNFHLATRTKRRAMPAHLALRCPRGDVLMYAETLTRGEAPLAYSRRGVRVRTHDLSEGRRVAVQITCREQSARLLLSRRLGFGTPHADRIATRAHGTATAFAGPGDDRIRLRGPNDVGNGGLGADRIVATSKHDVANGGPGDDLLVSLARRKSLLVGGPGHDSLIGSHGKTIINARDGDRDRVICRSSRNRVLVDRHDVVRGPCRDL
jgi:hypothetical protein